MHADAKGFFQPIHRDMKYFGELLY